MTRKTLVTWLLISFVGATLASVAYHAVKESRAQAAQQAAPPPEAPQAPVAVKPEVPSSAPKKRGPATPASAQARQEKRILAYYFHGFARCQTCMKLEAYTKEAIETGFGPDLKAGRIQWQAVNVEEPANTHFVKDFKLDTKTVILAISENGKVKDWENLDLIWDFVGDKERFLEYVQHEARSYQAKL